MPTLNLALLALLGIYVALLALHAFVAAHDQGAISKRPVPAVRSIRFARVAVLVGLIVANVVVLVAR